MELDWIRKIRQNVSTTSSSLILGIGDDAAILSQRGRDWVWTVDLLTEGVDFLLSETEPELIGRKALAVNLSDLAAMSAVPTAALIAVALPKEPVLTPNGFLEPLELADRLFAGILPLAKKYGVDIAGGDTNSWSNGLVLSITLLGERTEHGVLLRSGAKVGDRLFVTGFLGGSRLQHQFTFEPRVRESLFLQEHFDLHAGLDISDGLSLDLARLCAESGVGAILWEEAIPISEDARILAEWEQRGEYEPIHGKPVSALEHALFDGEDFELLFCLSPADSVPLRESQPLLEKFGVHLHEIGEITESPGLRIGQRGGKWRELVPRGFEH